MANYDNNFQITIFCQNRTMPRVFQTQVSPEVAHNESLLNDYVAKFFNTSVGNSKVIILKRSIDAQKQLSSTSKQMYILLEKQ
jgi:hypothetical protein